MITLPLFGPRQALLDQPSIDWLYQVFSWAQQQLGGDYFHQYTCLVEPTNAFFPGRVESPEGLAELLFGQVAGYAGMAHWPFRLVDGVACEAAEVLPVQLPADLRQRADAAGTAPRTAAALEIGYDPSQLRNPQVAIATYAQGLAHHLAAAVGELPPGGRENWYQVTEVVAVYLGFGIMLSNTAFTFRPGCGGCGVAGRDNALSEFDITYSLAIFCALKGLDANAAVPHLKRSLRGYFKRALKQVTAHRGRLSVH